VGNGVHQQSRRLGILEDADDFLVVVAEGVPEVFVVGCGYIERKVGAGGTAESSLKKPLRNAPPRLFYVSGGLCHEID
jgi:hypothetical protein